MCEKQFYNEYHREFTSDSRIKNFSRNDDLNLFLNIESSFKENENEITFHRKRNISSLLKNLIIVIYHLITFTESKKIDDNMSDTEMMNR